MNVKRIIFFIAAIILMNVCCFADTAYDSLYEQLKIEELVDSVPQQGAEAAAAIGLEDFSFGEILSLEPEQFWLLAREQFVSAITGYRREIFSIVVTVLLSAAVSVCCDDEKTALVFRLICVLVVTSLLCAPVIEQMVNCCEAIKGVALFMLSYIPVFASAAAASGAMMSAAAYQLPVMAAAQLISQLSMGFFLPLMQSYMLLTLGSTISNNKGLRSLCDSLKKLINWSLALVTTAFSGLLTLQSVFSHAADGAYSKTAKFLVGSFVPVIGGALSDAVSAMQGSVRVIKAGLGGFGVLAVTLSLSGPLIGVLALRAVIWLALTTTGFLPTEQIEGILTGFSNIMSIMQAILLSVLSVLLISTAIMLSIGGEIAL